MWFLVAALLVATLYARGETGRAMRLAGQWIKANLVADTKGTTNGAAVYGRMATPEGEAVTKREFDARMLKSFGPMRGAWVEGKTVKVRRCSPVKHDS